MLPLRLVFFTVMFIIMYPLMLVVGTLRAIYLRLAVGKPSVVLKYGAYPHPKEAVDGTLHTSSHQQCEHYGSQQLFSKPLDEEKLRKAVVELCAEDGIEEHEVGVKFFDEEPMDWPASGSYDVTSGVLKSFPKGRSYVNVAFGAPFGEAGPDTTGPYKIFYQVYNGRAPGDLTVVHFGGSVHGWDGSSNFNFNKEVMRRYSGLPPKKVFQRPEMKPESAAKLDEASFLLFLAKLPFNLFSNLRAAIWNLTRAAKWAGGNGAFVPIVVTMNFTEDESAKLYAGAKKQGASIFAAMSYATVKACKEVLGQAPTAIANQASTQTRHYPAAGQAPEKGSGHGKDRDFVGDWLIAPITQVDPDFTLATAQAKYRELIDDMDSLGPMTRNAMMAKAYGVLNSGASTFEAPPNVQRLHTRHGSLCLLQPVRLTRDSKRIGLRYVELVCSDLDGSKYDPRQRQDDHLRRLGDVGPGDC
jgi:hypothetical protein